MSIAINFGIPFGLTAVAYPMIGRHDDRCWILTCRNIEILLGGKKKKLVSGLRNAAICCMGVRSLFESQTEIPCRPAQRRHTKTLQ